MRPPLRSRLVISLGLLLTAPFTAQSQPAAGPGRENPTQGNPAEPEPETAGAPPTSNTPKVQSGEPKDLHGTPGFGSGAPRGSSGAYGANDQNAAATALDRSDREFLERVASEGQSESAIAQLGAERATDERVRAFARQLAEDHEATRSRVAELVAAADVPVENDLKANRDYRELKRESPRNFDKRFIAMIIERHRRDLKRVDVVARVAKDDRIREFASAHADALRKHLEQAHQLKDALRK